MKLFLDSANIDQIKKWNETGLLDGVTTNPSLLAKEHSNPKALLAEICSIVKGPVSIEVVEKEPEAVYRQAKELSQLAPNVIVKIPFAQEYLPVIARLAQEGVKINVTLVFSLLQALLVAKLGVVFISPFVGRWDDIDVNGMELVAKLMQMKRAYGFKCYILASSVRSLMHWHSAVLMGADVVTIPASLFEQVMHHPLTEQGIAKFDADWIKSGKQPII